MPHTLPMRGGEAKANQILSLKTMFDQQAALHESFRGCGGYHVFEFTSLNHCEIVLHGVYNECV